MNYRSKKRFPSPCGEGRDGLISPRNEGMGGVSWKHYSRKGYAAFQSIGRVVKIGVLGVAMLCTQQLVAQNVLTTQTVRDTTAVEENSLDELTVTGTMAPLAAMQQARIVSVITRDDINRAAAPTVNDLLKSVAGVDVRQRGGFSVQTDISIDGGTFDQVTILLNGINITNPQTGHHTMDLPVNTYDIERIEIIEGAASRVYGASAFGGAINIVTKGHDKTASAGVLKPNFELRAPLVNVETGRAPSKTEDRKPNSRHSRWIPDMTASVSGGSWGTAGGDIALGYKRHYVSVGAQRSDGGTTNSDLSRFTAFYKGGAELGKSSLDWQFSMSDKRYGANTFYSPKFPDQWEANRRFFASVMGDINTVVHLRPSVYWNRAYDHFQLVRGTSKGENYHRVDVIGGGLVADRAWAAGKTAVGANVRHERIHSTNLGQKRDVPDGRYTHADHRTQYDISLEHNVLLDKWTISAGLMASGNTAIDSRLRFYPGVDVSYRPDAHWRIYASYNRGFRMPTFTDLYYSGAERQGDGSLLPEETHSVSLGATHRSRWSSATARVFYHRGRHMIDWVKYTSADPVYYAADFDLDNLGAQVSLRFDLASLLKLGVPDLRLQTSYTYIHQWRHDQRMVYKSSYAGEYLRHKFTTSLTHTIYGPLSMCWNLRVCDRVGGYEIYADNQPTGALRDYSPYAVLDAKVQCQLPHLTLWLSGENVTNHRYYDFGNIPQPGICLIAGARWTLF